MKNIFLLLTILSITIRVAYSQGLAINTSGASPDVSAIMDASSSLKGLLIPRMNTATVLSISNPAKGLLVYDTAKNQLMVNMGTPAVPNWQTIVFKSGWSLTGNSGTDSLTNFIGTTDARPLLFRINNLQSGIIDSNLNNTGLGFRTLQSITTGNFNTSLGYKALITDSTGYDNTAIGADALRFTTTGSGNTAIGLQALQSNTTGVENNAMGYLALFSNTTGGQNNAIGNWALANNISGHSNVGVGYFALHDSQTGDGNIAIGTSAMYYNSSGSNNTAIGTYSMMHSDGTGNANVAIGAGALNVNLRSNIVAVGDSALFSNGSGATLAIHATLNTAIGSKALYANTIGYYNTALGYESLKNNTTGFYNTGIGTQTLGLNISGQQNIAIGTSALYSNLTGNNNTALGYGTLYRNTSNNNTALGYYVLGNNIAGDGNTGVGNQAMYNSNSGFENTGVGYQALYNNNFDYNVAIGTQALYNVSSGTAGLNTAIGSFAGYTATSQDRSTFLGYGTDASGSFTNSTAIGYNAVVNANNKVRIGNGSVTVVEGAASYTVSDVRFKNHVQENVPGLDFINALRPVTYQYNAYDFDKFLRQNNSKPLDSLKRSDYVEAENMIHMGLIAQELEKLIKDKGYKLDVVHTPSNPTDNYSIAYGELIAPLIKAMQEQQQQIEKLKKENAEIKSLLQQLAGTQKGN